MKRRKKPAWRKLYDENWELCREIVKLRDGYVCRIPGCEKREKLQLDHVISRNCKTTFFETDILGYLCPDHHTHKSFRKNQWVDLTVRDICKEMVGDNRWDGLLFESRKLCPRFATLGYQEEINALLKKEKEILMKEVHEKQDA